MATRNLTVRFENFRSSHSRSNTNSTNTNAALLGGESSSTGLTYVLPPQWVDIVESVQADIKTINELCKKLSLLFVILFFLSRKRKIITNMLKL